MKVADKIEGPVDTMVMFFCPACQEHHGARVAGPSPVWGWNGSLEKPTFTPSLRITSYRGHEAEHQCHIIVTDGVIAYQADSWKMAGETVPIPAWDD